MAIDMLLCIQYVIGTCCGYLLWCVWVMLHIFIQSRGVMYTSGRVNIQKASSSSLYSVHVYVYCNLNRREMILASALSSIHVHFKRQRTTRVL